MTKTLTAVNSMLSGIGQAPINTLEEDNPEIGMALHVLDQVSLEVQAEQWNFNTEYSYPFMPDSNGFITVPDNVISLADNKVDEGQTYQLVLRDGKLYDKLGHSFVFPTGFPVQCDVVWKFAFDDLPAPFQAYITQRATRVFAARTQGSREMVTFNSQDELLLRNSCLEYDTQTAKTSIFGVSDGRNFYTSYAPFEVIAR